MMDRSFYSLQQLPRLDWKFREVPVTSSEQYIMQSLLSFGNHPDKHYAPEQEQNPNSNNKLSRMPKQVSKDETMSHSSSSYISTSYASYSSSSGTAEGQSTGSAYKEQSHTDPSGTTVHTTSQNLGEAPVQETRQFDSQGRQLVDSSSHGAGQRQIGDAEVEDVTESERDKEAARQYQERMEDEYAKREGGA